MEGRAQFLDGLPGDVDLVVAFVGSDRPLEPGALAVGESLGSAAQEIADAVQRVSGVAAVA